MSRQKRGRSYPSKWSSQQLHQVARMLQQRSFFEDNSSAQDWLFGKCVRELERRHKKCPSWVDKCWCDLCVGPFS